MVATRSPRPAAVVLLAGLGVVLSSPPAARAQVPADALEVAVIGGYHSLDRGRGRDRTQAIFVAGEVARFLGRSHEIGARFDFFAIDSSSPGVTLAGIYSYNFDTGESVVPFLGVGFGIGFDSVPLVGPVPAVVDDVNRQLAFSAGTKNLIGNSAALRIEYRYDRILRDAEDNDRHSVLFGVALFLGPELRAPSSDDAGPRPEDVGY
ncbi:MAG: hypothetical protein PVF43_14605 [Candidatus Eiseniibacteriota bacterium]|jgi:hypothetical protein